MQIGEVIRKYRKERHMTQEEMARRLGVTTPAVNKWENQNSYPDITLLAPIARLLGITLDELLSFRYELTDEEVIGLVKEADRRFKQDSYEETYQWIKGKMEEYPNCLQLIWQLAVEAQNAEKVRYYAAKQSALATLFEMGRYHEISCFLEPAVLEKDEQRMREIQDQLLQSVDSLTAFTESPLYEHMIFKKQDRKFVEEVRNHLREQFEKQD